jgi:signal transduction histidine kinase
MGAAAAPEARRPDRDGEGLEVIIRNARLQAQLVADLLDMSGILSGQMRLDVGDVDLVAVIESGIQTLRPTADEKHIRIDAALDPGGARDTRRPPRASSRSSGTC